MINTHLPHQNDFAGSVVMDVRAYKSMLEPVLGRRYKNPYLWCFQGILIGYSSWIRETEPGEKVNFIFEDNKQEFRDALKLYERVAHLPDFSESKDCVGTIEPGDDRNLMPPSSRRSPGGSNKNVWNGQRLGDVSPVHHSV